MRDSTLVGSARFIPIRYCLSTQEAQGTKRRSTGLDSWPCDPQYLSTPPPPDSIQRVRMHS